MKKIHLLIIDPQNDFCHPDGSLYVTGSPDDLVNINNLLDYAKEEITDIHVSLDMHNIVDISHSCWFRDKNGDYPKPFTKISREDLHNGKWVPISHINSTENYLERLEAFDREHIIWPYHCLVGSWGSCVVSWLNNKLSKIEENRISNVNYYIKGLNPLTEHFSIFSAVAPLDNDPTTQLNWNLLNPLLEADMVLISGEASSHCVAESIRDLASVMNFKKDKSHSKIYILSDAMSPVKGFKHLETQMFDDMRAKGVCIVTVSDMIKILSDYKKERFYSGKS